MMRYLVLPCWLNEQEDISLVLTAGDEGSTVITKHYRLMNNEKTDVSMRYLVRDYFQRQSQSESE